MTDLLAEDFHPENELESLMLAARAGEVPMPDLVKRLVNAHVFVPAETSQEAGSGNLSLPRHRGRDGSFYAPVFTSRERLLRFTGGDWSATLPFRDLAGSWPEDLVLVLNPGELVQLVLPGTEVLRLGRPTQGPSLVPAGTSVMVGEPAEDPEQVLRTVAAACSVHPEIAAAYRAQIHIDRPGESPHLAVGLLFDGSGEGLERTCREITEAAARAGAEGVTVLSVTEEPSGNGIADYTVQSTAPFYEAREPWQARSESAVRP